MMLEMSESQPAPSFEEVLSQLQQGQPMFQVPRAAAPPAPIT
jgi:hypothetical protein